MAPAEDPAAKWLPKGWRRGHLTDGRMHFIHSTGKTSLVNPWVDFYESGQHEAELGPLPKGWELYWNPAGRPMFRHEASQRFQLSDPRCLPDGWEFRAGNDGSKSWYIDHNAKSTSWDHPYESKNKTEIIGPLPAGWSVSFTSDGKEYFVNHKDKTTKRIYPASAGIFALIDMLRPDEWEIHFTPNRILYLVNSQTRTTYWILPHEEKRLTEVTGPLPDGCEIRLSPYYRYYVVDHITNTTRWLENPTRSSDDVPALDLEDGFGPLPSGWIKRQTLDNLVVFLDQNTKTTIWFDPRYSPQPPNYASSAIPLPVSSVVALHTGEIGDATQGSSQTQEPSARNQLSPEQSTTLEKKEHARPLESRPSVKTKELRDNESFQYRKLEKDEIRILLIQPASKLEAPLVCTLQHVSLSATVKYDALSYTWGDRKNPAGISVDDQDFTIRENARCALRRLRLLQTQRAIWIDAICINQNDISEKSLQLPLMTKIYQQAQQVCIWLGDETEGSIIGMARLKNRSKTTKLSKYIKDTERKHGNLLLPLWARFSGGGALQDSANRNWELDTGEIRELLCRPWWSRVWIMQEVIVGHKPVILCGSDAVEWEALAKWRYTSYQQSQSGTRLNMEPFGLGSPQELDILDDFYQTLSYFRRLWETHKWGVFIYDLLYQFRHLGCSDPKDRIFGFLGLTPLSSDSNFKPNYSLTLYETYRNFTRGIIEHFGTLDILNYKREWKQVEPVTPPVYAYSMIDQAKYHDIHASIIDGEGKKPRMGWARLPPGWERRENGNAAVYFDWNSNKYDTSPLAGHEPCLVRHVSEQKICPPGWRKSWDNLGRVQIFYDPDATDEQEVTHSSELSRLPSWVPNWACRTHQDPSPLLDWTDSSRMFSAGGNDSIKPQIGNNPDTLDLQGGQFDEIHRISQPWHPASDSPPMSRKDIKILESWEALGIAELPDCPYGGAEGRKNALWRTHIADLPGAHAAPKKDRWLVECWYDRVGWARGKPRPQDLVGKGIWKTAAISQAYQSRSERDMHNHYLGLLEAEWHRMFHAGEMPDAELSKKEISKYFVTDTKDSADRYGVIARRIYEACKHRALYVTARGYIGLAPWNARVGDKAFVLRGGKTPFLLREAGQRSGAYELVGETYLYGIMGGEGLQLCDGGVRDVRLM